MAKPYDAECRDGYLLGQECPSCHAMEGTPHVPDMVTALPKWTVRTVRLCRLCGKPAGHPAHRKAGRCG